MKTALSIVQEAFDRMNIGIRPTALYGQTDPTTLQTLAILYATLEELRAARCWAEQKRTYSFDTEADRANYPLPTDFYSPLPNTAYDDDIDQELDGPLTDGEAKYRLVSGVNFSPYGWRIFGPDILRTTAGQFQFDQTPAAGVTIKFEYLTASYFIPANWNGADTTLREAIAADTDLVLFPADVVKAGFRAKWIEDAAGDYTAARAEFESKISEATARMIGPRRGSFGGGRGGPRYTIPYRSWSI